MDKNRLIKYVSLIPISAYLFMMCIKPWFDSGYSWQYVQSVWSSWQTFNAGMTAFSASIIALYVVGYKERVGRERKLIAAQALMPSALSEISDLCTSHFKLLHDAYLKRDTSQSKRGYTPLYLEGEIVKVSTWANEILKECIISSEKKDGEFIARLCSDLQVNRSRLQSIHKSINSKCELLVNDSTIEGHIIELAFITAKLNRLFPFARMEKELYTGKVFRQELFTALFNIGCDDMEFPNVFEQLKGYTNVSDEIPDVFKSQYQ